MSNETAAPADRIDMDKVAGLLREVHGIENAHVQHTGGGVMALYAGPTRPDLDNDPSRDVLFAALAGPGFNDADSSYFDTAELLVGCDDNGESDPVELGSLGVTTAEQVAAVIAAQAQLSDPTQPLDAAAAQALLA